jgi:hypothetical protein
MWNQKSPHQPYELLLPFQDRSNLLLWCPTHDHHNYITLRRQQITSPLCLQPKHEQTQTSNNDFLNSLRSLNWVLDFEELFVYGNILMKLMLFAKFCVMLIFVDFFHKKIVQACHMLFLSFS